MKKCSISSCLVVKFGSINNDTISRGNVKVSTNLPQKSKTFNCDKVNEWKIVLTGRNGRPTGFKTQFGDGMNLFFGRRSLRSTPYLYSLFFINGGHSGWLRLSGTTMSFGGQESWACDTWGLIFFNTPFMEGPWLNTFFVLCPPFKWLVLKVLCCPWGVAKVFHSSYCIPNHGTLKLLQCYM